MRPGPPAHGCGDHRELSAGGRHHPGTCRVAHLHGRSRRHPVSGALPETERERQVRQLAGRLLTWPDPEGPVSVDLIPVGYPDDFPPELVDLTELRFLGSVVRRRAGTLVAVEMVFEGPGEPEAVMGDFEAALLSLGWERLEQPHPMRGGFDAGSFPEMSLLVERRKSVAVNLQAMHREDGGSGLRGRYDPLPAQA